MAQLAQIIFATNISNNSDVASICFTTVLPSEFW